MCLIYQVNVNWLPPLLEPIVISPTIVTTPTMDYLFPATFQYGFMNGTRGVFDDLMWYQWLPLRGIESKIYPEPYRVNCLLIILTSVNNLLPLRSQ